MKYMNKEYICSIDETGRGSLLSILVVGAVVTTPKEEEVLRADGVTDSKKITDPRKREYLYDLIRGTVTDHNIGIVGPDEIDQLGIEGAWNLGCYRAVKGLYKTPTFIKVDGNRRISALSHINQEAITKGDLKEVSIGAASILAKVWRDRYILNEIEDLSINPLYGINSNKGYPTKQHLNALIEIGPTTRHRKTFIKKYVNE